MKRAGFTLMEFIVVVVIILLLCGLVLPAVQMVQDASRAAKAKQEPATMPYADDTPEKMPYLEE